MDHPTDEACFAAFPPAVLRPAELLSYRRGGGARTIPPGHPGPSARRSS